MTDQLEPVTCNQCERKGRKGYRFTGRGYRCVATQACAKRQTAKLLSQYPAKVLGHRPRYRGDKLAQWVVCSCTANSGPYPSQDEARLWHRQHLARVIQAIGDQTVVIRQP